MSWVGFEGFREKVSDPKVKDGPGVIPAAGAGTVMPPGTTTPALDGRMVNVSPFTDTVCAVEASWNMLLPITTLFEGP